MLKDACNFRIALSVYLAGHGEIHADLTPFTRKGVLRVLNEFVADLVLIGNPQFVCRCKLRFVFNGHFLELAGRGFSNRTLPGSLIPLIDITADGTDKFLLHNVLVLTC